MPVVRKVPAADAARWEDEAQIDPAALVTAVAGGDRTGLTRMDYDSKRMHGWMARVYANHRTFTRYYADETHGGPEAALRKAVAWRAAQRRAVTISRRSGRTWRIVRVDRPDWKSVGYYAYADHRRYFSDARYGGSGGALAAAEAWMKERERTATNDRVDQR
jgi:hypothetical protein